MEGAQGAGAVGDRVFLLGSHLGERLATHLEHRVVAEAPVPTTPGRDRAFENSFDKGDLEFLRTLANHAGVAIENARLHDRLQAENQTLRSEIQQTYGGRMIVGEHPKVKQVLDVVARVADANATVLVRGESGTGKELVARALHERSHRSDAPIIAVNCAAIPEGLIESELFGHEKGAFTGADSARRGMVESADSGTLFLDEIGELPLTA